MSARELYRYTRRRGHSRWFAAIVAIVGAGLAWDRERLEEDVLVDVEEGST